MNCTNCGTQVANDTVFCPQCGAELQAPPVTCFCGKCGAPMTTDDAFCAVCGASVNEIPTPTPPHTSPTALPPKKSSSGTIILILALVLVLASSCFAGYALWKGGVLPFGESHSESSKRDDDEKETETPKRTERPTQTPEPVKDEDGDYLFPTDTEYISRSDLYGLSKDEVDLIRNEIYARHGYIFKQEPFISYFNAKDWYHPNQNFDVSMFNEIEKENLETLVEYEKERGWY